MAKRNLNNVKGMYKTDSHKGTIEYKPSKTYMAATPKNKEQSDEWEKEYRDNLKERIRKFKPFKMKSILNGDYENLALFNDNLEHPLWTWNEEEIENQGTWILRDIAVVLENDANLKK